MDDEPTKKTDKDGAEADKALAPDDKPISDYDKALELVKRREEVTKVELEVLAKKEKLAANELLAGTTGGNVPIEKPKEETPHEYRMRINKEMAEGKIEFGN